MNKTCEKCGAEIHRKGNRGRYPKYCDACRYPKALEQAREYARKNYDYKPKVITSCTCLDCGKEIERKGPRGPMPKRCDDCNQAIKHVRAIAQSEQSKRQRHERLAGRQCKCCGKPLKIKQPTYCSKRCYYLDTFGERVCVQCGKPFVATYDAQACCGNDCANEKANKTKKGQRDTSIVKICVICGQEFSPYKGKHTQVTCSPYCKRQRDSINKVKSGYKKDINRRRRLIVSATESESFDKIDIFERDGWVCQICGKKVNRNLSYPNPKSASLDHILPMALGGGHTRANVQLAHLRCNIKKSDSGGGQLRLVSEI